MLENPLINISLPQTRCDHRTTEPASLFSRPSSPKVSWHSDQWPGSHFISALEKISKIIHSIRKAGTVSVRYSESSYILSRDVNAIRLPD